MSAVYSGNALPSTPFLAVDAEVMRQNIRRVADHAASAGLQLRPHVKTHKCLPIARLQLDAGAVGITVATIGEAEVFAKAGFADIFIAYPLWVDAARAARMIDLASGCRLRFGVDSVPGVVQAAKHLEAAGVELVIEVDSGHHRSGALPEDVDSVARAAQEHGLAVAGVFTFPGHSYSSGGRGEAALQEADALRGAADGLRRMGFEPSIVSGGATPSVEFASADVLTEIRPGVYVFGDAQQWELGSCTRDQIALTAHGTVVSHAGGRVVVDAGSKVLGADKAVFATGYGRLLDHPAARIVQLSEHHAVVEMNGQPLPPLGSVLRVVPNHVCNAVNLVDELIVFDGDAVSRWPVAARGRNG